MSQVVAVEIPQHTVGISLYIPGRMSCIPGEEDKVVTVGMNIFVTCQPSMISMPVDDYDAYKKGLVKINLYYAGTYAPIYMHDTKQYENIYVDDFTVTL